MTACRCRRCFTAFNGFELAEASRAVHQLDEASQDVAIPPLNAVFERKMLGAHGRRSTRPPKSSSPPRPPSPAPPPPTRASAAYTGVAAYNPGTLAPPPLPTPAVLTNPIPINLQNSAMPGLGVKQKSHGRDPQRACAVEEPDGHHGDDADTPAPNVHWFLGIPWPLGGKSKGKAPQTPPCPPAPAPAPSQVLVHTATHAHTPAPSTRAWRYQLGLPWTPLARQLHPFPVLAFAAASPHAPPPLPVMELRVHMHMMCARRVPRRRRSSCTGVQADSSRACAALSTRNLPPPISALLSTSPSPSPSLPSSLLPFLLQVYTAKHYGILLRASGLWWNGAGNQAAQNSNSRSIGFDTRVGKAYSDQIQPGCVRCSWRGIHTYNLRWEGGKFDIEYRGVERGYYGLKQRWIDMNLQDDRECKKDEMKTDLNSDPCKTWVRLRLNNGWKGGQL
ncbi:hypothetical protein B0H16DRAFT_1690888 [Mycena metata]|uniref:Uncharacterized protein n=1 Tax=Mycena metata TaxID=1033252 RepID=A0AAD7J015_9AGAR|nr:hypothetical protein B0H16DRAFT_1690888 [Mycena metata]